MHKIKDPIYKLIAIFLGYPHSNTHLDYKAWSFDKVRKPIISENSEDVSFINASTGGLFIPEVKHWEKLSKGDMIGRIIDPLSGKVLQDIESPVDGILFTIREYPIVDEGSLIGRLLKEN